MGAGAGAFDANGIWQYGESDADALFSDLLNRGQGSTSAQLTADRTRLGNLEKVRPGTLKVAPASVVVNAGVGAVDAARTVRLSGAVNKVSLNGVFGGAFENYRVTTRVKASAAAAVSINLRAAGVDAVATNYSYEGFDYTGPTGGGGGLAGAAAWSATNRAGTEHVVTIMIYGPALAATTTMQSDFYTINAANRTVGRMGGDHSLATAYDGISFALSGGATMTGLISVEGMN